MFPAWLAQIIGLISLRVLPMAEIVRCGRCNTPLHINAAPGTVVPCPVCGIPVSAPIPQAKTIAKATFTFSCPRCGTPYESEPSHAGQKFACACGQRLQVPKPPIAKTVLGKLPGADDAAAELVVTPESTAPAPLPLATAIRATPPPLPQAEPLGSLQDQTELRPRKKRGEKYCCECGEVINAKAEICPKCGVRQRAGFGPRENPDWEPHRGTVILVLGIVGLFTVPFILGPIVWIWANADLRKMDDGLMDPEGKGNTQGGKVCGMIATILSLVALGFIVLYFLFCCGLCGLGGLMMPRNALPPPAF